MAVGGLVGSGVGADVFFLSDRRRTRLYRAAVVGVLLLATAAALVVGRWWSPWWQPATALVIAWVSVLSGAEVLLRGWAGGPEAVFRRWLGAAMVVWGAGGLVRSGLPGGASHAFPTVDRLVPFAAAPLAVAGVVTIPRAIAARVPPARVALDGALLSACVSAVIWRAFLVGDPAHFTGQSLVAVMILAQVSFTCLAVVIAVRDLALPLIVVAAGFAAFSAGDLLALTTSDTAPSLAFWIGRLSWLVSTPVVAWGTLRYRAGPRVSEDTAPIDVDPDARVTVVTTTTSLALLGLAVAWVMVEDGGAAGRPLDVVTWLFVLSAIGLLWIRELLNTRLRVRLIGRLHEEATSDPLTGLANRRMLTARVDEVPPEEAWCLLALDIDGFKAVNDLLGHTVGDRLLCAVGDRLVRTLARTSLVARIGGDEFVALVPGDVDDGLAAAERALHAVRRACWDVEGVTRLPVSASVGVTAVGSRAGAGRHRGDPALPPSWPGTTDHLSALSAAAAALQLAKAGGRDRIEVFDGAAAMMRSRRLWVEERLRAAIREGLIDVQYQPVVDLATGVITGVEALARWTDARLGPIAPQEFIPIAEQTGLVIELGDQVLRRALDDAVEHGLPGRGIRVACNVSPLQLRVPDFYQRVEAALATRGIPPDMLLVEVTEAVLVEEHGPAVQSLRRLAEVGVAIAIDDFGTGYSALGYLRRMPAHVLKIDRSLTSVIIDEPAARAITAAVIDLARTLDVSIVVEGIETSDVAELVAGMGAGFGQGSLYGSAMPMSEIVRLSRRPPAGLRRV